MKFGLKQLRNRTPNLAFKIGNALVVACGFASASVITISPTTATILAWGGIVGKFVTELFGDDKG